MAPLILHNVPEEELYTGEDGVQRPYAMIFPGGDGPTTSMRRKNVPETGSFGKSTRRSRSKTATPAAKREDPTLLASDAIFAQFLSQQPAATSESLPRKASLNAASSQKALAQIGASTGTSKETTTAIQSRYVQRTPTEVILGGFGEGHSYAAIKHYEQIGGFICEDYPRDPPVELRKFKSDLRDPASLRKRALTPEEKAKALYFAGGEHWIKVTFESAEAADAAIYASPQNILGHQVYAELYRGAPPSTDEPIPANHGEPTTRRHSRHNSRSGLGGTALAARRPSAPRGNGELTRINESSPNGSQSSTNTLDTTTLSTITGTSTSSATIVAPQEDQTYCRRIPSAKRAQLLPAEQALLPQKTLSQRVARHLPVVSWLNMDVIGPQVPRTELGEFDWVNASLYWRLMWLLDFYLRIFGGDIVGADKEE